MIESLGSEVPEHVDKGGVDEKKLVELYSHFGSYLEAGSKPVEDLNDLKRVYGDCSNELLYLRENRLIQTFVDDEVQVKLRGRERSLARSIHQFETQGLKPYEILEHEDFLPNYIQHPEFPGYEETKEKMDIGSQQPCEELITRIIKAVPRENGSKPQRITENMNVETNFQIERWLRYLETQKVVQLENGKYSLQETSEVTELLEETETQVESLKQRQRHKNNPWKI